MTSALSTPEVPPYFTLQVGAGFCRCDLRVNDIPLMTDDLSGSRVDVEIPLNPLVFTGENTLTVKLQPARTSPQGPDRALDHPLSRCSVELIRKPYGAPGVREVLASIVYEGGDAVAFAGSSVETADVSPLRTGGDAKGTLAASRSVRLATPYPEWRWVRAPPVAPSDEVVRDILLELQRFWAALRDKDIPTLRSVMAHNLREVQSAYYLADMDDAWRAVGVEALLRNRDAVLKPMPTELTLEVFADGRLVRMVDARGDSPIAFDERDTGLDAFLQAWFCRAGVGLGWVMIR